MHDLDKERRGLVQMDSKSLTFEDPTTLELSRRNIKEAINNVRAEQEERKADCASQSFQ
jgi:hypothetical protein